MGEPSENIDIDVEAIASASGRESAEDPRPKIEPPPPIRLVAVEDCQLWAAAGLERELDSFYVGLLNFEREQVENEIVYRAENLRLRIAVLERPAPREDYRPLGLSVESIQDLVQRLNQAKIEYVQHYGLTPGQDNLLLSDPAGNPVEITESRFTV